MLFIRRRVQGVGLILALIYFYGSLLGALYLLQSWLFGKLPQWPWWQFGLAPFALGAAALAVEWALEALTKGSSKWHISVPAWKKVLFLLFLLLVASLYAFQSVLWPCTSC